MDRIEETILGNALRKNQTAQSIVSIIGERADTLENGEGRIIYRAIRSLVERGEEVNPARVAEQMKAQGTLEQAGGAMELSRLCRMPEEEMVETMAQLLVQSREEQGREIVYADDLREEVEKRLDGWREDSYGLGFAGTKTDRRIRLTEEGGLWILTGMPNSGKTAWLRCVLTQLMVRGRRVAMVSFEEMNKAKQIVKLVQIITGQSQTKGMPKAMRDRILEIINRRQVHLIPRKHEATVKYILELADREWEREKIDFLVVDPYLYIEEEEKAGASETQRIKHMLKSLRQWAEKRHVWVIVVAHPRMLRKDENGEYETVDQYTISGSAHWANMADYVCSIKRVFIRKDPDKGSEVPSYTQVDVVKVRDQDVCRTGRLYYLRSPAGRYKEMEDDVACQRELAAAERDPQGHAVVFDKQVWGE